MPSSAKKRARAASRARTTLPRKRRATSSQVLARRGMIALGIIVAASLIVALVGTVASNNGASTPVAAPSQSDPSELIRAATANPNNSDAVGALADYSYRTGQQQQALALYQRYLTLRPDDARARVSVGELLLGSGDIQGAQSQFVQAITFASPTTDQQTAARAHLDLGDVYTASTPPRPNDALTEYQQAANLDPSGAVGDQARQKLASLQQQVAQPAVTVIVPSVSGTSPSRPTGTP